MHLRKLVLACGFASFALSNYASALGLGEVKLNSKLNQPLNAEVKLLDTRDLSAEQILIGLASPADFERNGVERLYFYTEFQFEVMLDHAGGPIIKITTRNPVREPYLNFLIEARWTAGRLLREYTLLMDLPTFDDAAPQAVQAAASANKPAAAKPEPTTKKTAPVEAPVTTTEKPAPAAVTEEKPGIIAEQDQPAKKSSRSTSAGTYGPIENNDTLWEIAKSVRPDSSVSVHQTMLALQRLNPDAFIHGNINLLKKGQVLRVPDASEAASVSKSDAVSQVNAQNSDWSSGTSSSTTALGAQLDATRHASGTRHQDESVSGRVKLEAPSGSNKAGSGQASGSNKGSGKALESELASTLEELDKAKSEKTELSSRVHDLEEQVKTMQRLVDVSNEKLRAMQLNAAKQPEKTADKPSADTKPSVDAKPSTAKTDVAVPTSSVANASVAAEAPAPQSSAAAVSVAAKSSVPAVKKPPVVVAPPEKSVTDILMDNILWLGLGVLAFAGAGVIYARRRKAQAEAAEQQVDESDIFNQEPDFAAFNESQVNSFDEVPAEELAPAFEEEEISAVAETGDVVGEADIYIAYGKYDQAEEMLLNGLAKDPQSTDIKMKLLEVYSQSHNLPEFDKHYSALRAGLSAAALMRVEELRSNIPGAGEFVQPSAIDTPAIVQTDDSSLDFNLDDFDISSDTKVETAEEDFSFDLDLDDADADVQLPHSNYDMDLSEKPKQASAIDELDDDFSLDFDLDNHDSHAQTAGEAEDLSEISLALDDLKDNRTLLDDSDLETKDEVDEEEFSFDFNDIEEDEGQLAHEVEAIKSPQQLEVTDNESADEFNLDMDVADVDLAALDHEMESLDADLELLDEETPADVKHETSEHEFAAHNFAESETDFDEPDFNEPGFTAPGFSESEVNIAEDDLVLESDDDDELDDLRFDEADDLDFENDTTANATTEVDFEALDAEFDEEELALFNEEAKADIAELDAELASAELESELSFEEELDFEEEPGFEEESSFEKELSGEENLLDVDALDEELAADDNLFDERVSEADVAELDTSFAELDLDDDFNLADVSDDLEQETAVLETESSHEVETLDEAESPDEAETSSEIIAETQPSHSEEIADDDVFEQALSDFSADNLDFDSDADLSEDDMDAELDFMADADEAATKLDLARAYIDMGDNDGARDILTEVAQEGNDEQRQEAMDLLGRIDV